MRKVQLAFVLAAVVLALAGCSGEAAATQEQMNTPDAGKAGTATPMTGEKGGVKAESVGIDDPNDKTGTIATPGAKGGN
jgi:pectate lyase